MSKLPGIAMIVAGVGVAAYGLPWEAGVPHSANPLEEIQAPEMVVKAVEAPAAPAWQTTYAPAAPERTAATPPAASAPPPKRVAVAEVPPRMPVSHGAWGAAPAADRASLAREIQRHLKRVGCYDGDVSGVWSPLVRRAMKSFTDRMNATLPVDEPDLVLLALVENYGSQACGRPCAPGQPDDSRCVPSTVITAGTRLSLPGPAADNQVGVLPVTPAPLEGRMALAGPKADAPEAATMIPPAHEIAKTAPRVDKSYAGPQRRDRQRNRSAVKGPLPAWAMPRAMP